MRIAINAVAAGARAAGHVRAYAGALFREYAAMRPADADFLVYAERGRGPEIPLPNASPPGFFPGGTALWEQWRLHAKVFEDKVDVVHCVAYAMPRWCLAPTVITVPDVLPLPGRGRQDAPPWLKAAARRLPASLTRAGIVAVPSRAVRDELLKWNDSLPAVFPKRGGLWGIAAEKAGFSRDGQVRSRDLDKRVRVVPWGVEDVFFRTPVIRDAKKRLAEQGVDRYVLVPSPEGDGESLAAALKAWYAAVRRHRLGHHLTVVAGSADRGLRRFVREAEGLGAASQTHAVVADAPEIAARLYAGADAVMIPGRAGSGSLSLLRALAMRAPVLAPPGLDGDGLFRNHPSATWVGGDSVEIWREALERVLLKKSGGTPDADCAAPAPWRVHAEAMLDICRETAENDRRRHETLIRTEKP